MNSKVNPVWLRVGGFDLVVACEECTKQISDEYKYCPHCGKEIDWTNYPDKTKYNL